jgi:thiamine pyrophosphokinase
LLYTLIFANGEPNDGQAVRNALAGNGSPRLIIAADGGARIAESFGITPDLIVGDFDSVGDDALARAQSAGTEIVRFPAAKDETDLELALLTAVMRNANPIRIIGAIGGRLDQMLGNVYLLALPELRDRDVKMVSGTQTAWLAHPGTIKISGEVGDTLSLLPMAGEAVGVETTNLAYPLRRETLYFGPARGMSNVLTEKEATVSFTSGLLLIVHTIGKA